MARRAAARVTRRPRKPSRPSSAAGGEDGAGEDARPQEPPKRSAAAGGFFCCYLLRSLCPRLKGRTYIGFTVNPRRRIRQHNGEISSGAWRTRKGRPWEMVLCIYGFPTSVAALQFEWAWQHPRESLAVRETASGFKSLSGAGNKVKLAYAMLNLPSWVNLNLTVNFFSSTSTKFAAGCAPLPSQMKTVFCPMEDLQCHAEAIREDHGPSSQENDISEDSQGHQGSDLLHRVKHSRKQPSSDQVQPMEEQTRTADYDAEEENYSSDDFSLVERDGIFDLTEPDGLGISSQCSLSSNSNAGPSSQEDNIDEDPQARRGPPDCPRGDGHSEHSWKQPFTDQVQPMDAQTRTADAQTRTAVYDMEKDNYSGDEFVPMEWDGILDLTEPDRSRTSPHCSLSSDGNSNGVVEDEVGHVSSVWKVCGGDGGVVNDELGQVSPMRKGRVFQDQLGQALSPLWKAAGSDGEAMRDELGLSSPVLKVGADSDSNDSGVTDDELGQTSQMLMGDAGSDEGERDAVVDLVTPTTVGRLRRRAGTGICPGVIDLTASPVVIEL